MSKRLPSTDTHSGPVPVAGTAPVPVWLFVLLGLLAFWGMNFLDQRAGGFHPSVYGPYRGYDQLEALLPKSEGDALFAKGQGIYATYCSVCHQSTGQGLPGQFPPLAESDWVNTPGSARLIRLVLNGIQGPITVNGQAFNGAMPPWRDLLTDEAVASVLTYVRQNQNWGNEASPVTPDQVKAIRDETAGRVTAWNPEELLRAPDAN